MTTPFSLFYIISHIEIWTEIWTFELYWTDYAYTCTWLCTRVMVYDFPLHVCTINRPSTCPYATNSTYTTCVCIHKPYLWSQHLSFTPSLETSLHLHFSSYTCLATLWQYWEPFYQFQHCSHALQPSFLSLERSTVAPSSTYRPRVYVCMYIPSHRAGTGALYEHMQEVCECIGRGGCVLEVNGRWKESCFQSRQAQWEGSLSRVSRRTREHCRANKTARTYT